MEDVRRRLDTWTLTRYVAWSKPDEDTLAKARLHLPETLREEMDQATLEHEIRKSFARTAKLRDDYVRLVSDATLVWGLANEMRIDESAAGKAFASALTQCEPRSQRLVGATRRLYIEAGGKVGEDIYEEFLSVLAKALVDERMTED